MAVDTLGVTFVHYIMILKEKSLDKSIVYKAYVYSAKERT
jgi:hypothetical protein